MTNKDIEKAVLKVQLKQYIKPSSKLLIIIKSVSASGMSRRIKVFTINKDNFMEITYLIGELLDLSYNTSGLLIRGCGMDMTFWLANALTKALEYKDTLFRVIA